LLNLDFSNQQHVFDIYASDEYQQQVLDFCKRWLQGAQKFLFHTSGSTGVPKQIWIDRKRLEASATATLALLNVSEQDHFLCCLPIQNIGGAMVLIRAMMAKASCTVLQPTLTPLNLLLAQHNFTVASFVPSQLTQLDDRKICSVFEQIATVLVGGAPIRVSLETQLAACKNTIYHTYGMTETVSHIAVRKIGHESSFQTLPGISINLNDEQCLCIKAAVTDDKWIATNDVAELISSNQFRIIGRKDFVINTGGVKVPAEVVEALLCSLLPSGADAIIVPTDDEQFGQVVTAIVSGIDETSPLLPKIQSDLKDKLPPYYAPRKWIFVDQIPYTAAGKPDRKRWF
jgi:O-succinylbenzoic acid--CoA ligase